MSKNNSNNKSNKLITTFVGAGRHGRSFSTKPTSSVVTTATTAATATNKQISHVQNPRTNNEDVNKCFDQIGTKYNVNLEKYWKNRTNLPYKNILYDQKYDKQITKEDDLILHKVSKIDKIKEEQVNKYKENLERHDNELKIIYSANKKAEHYKQFEYNHKHKYRVANLPSAQQTELKNTGTKYLQREKQKMDRDKLEKERILTSILEGI